MTAVEVATAIGCFVFAVAGTGYALIGILILDARAKR